MTNNKQVQIIIRATEEEKKQITELAKEKDLSVNQFIKNQIFSNQKLEQDNNINNENNDINNNIITILQEELKIKNQQIDNLHKIIYNKDTKLLEYDSKKSWWQFWK
ncbi:hypothetical protein GKS24_01630 [Streptococcus uberis]|uniref:Uncharacterized protein n=1 Tax=Streptococcus uberis TaxID=1349 RepID=A0A6L6G7K8_STRUB|nr:hypothetical protein [Streptococcus uberis]MTB36084.1 hypothetical protein [Streptococcus uberis]MTB77331.1 hypothetical protein [Streptococcus uberis]MTC86741.1 hypothetical protein [Streptococcus uberis]MTD01117.1 hypothetical protein [Streptococcus uberis]